ncbi:MAG: TVP38/TMEM64 family protein [Betaproteobacteria bacterium]
MILLAALAAAWRWTPLAEYLTPQRIMGWARAVRETPWAPLVAVLAYTPASLILFPRPLVTLFIVVAFGLWHGIAYSVTGVLLAALVTYYLGRAMPQQALRNVAGDGAEALAKGARRHGVLSVLAFNLMPVPPFAVQNMIAGAARIRVWEYMLGSLLSLIPGIVAMAVFGDQVLNALREEAQVSWWAVAGALTGMGVLVFFAKRWAVKYAGASR